jgi:hypothetical protein
VADTGAHVADQNFVGTRLAQLDFLDLELFSLATTDRSADLHD